MPALTYAVTSISLFGHLALWTGLLSRSHAINLPRWCMEIVEKLILVSLLGGPALLLLHFGFAVPFTRFNVHSLLLEGPLAVYTWLCFGVAILVVASWVWRIVRGPPRQTIGCRCEIVDLRQRQSEPLCGGGVTGLMARMPGNQLFQLEINQKTLVADRLPADLHGLSIAHISDLHFTGNIKQAFFDRVVDRTNAMQADLIAITGDIIDVEPCLPWIGETLGRLQAEAGVYCIFGNHDRRIGDLQPLVREVETAGLHYLGGRRSMISHRGREILLAGNELPWITPAADVEIGQERDGPSRPFRVLLAHTPDQIVWARARDFDLMLAGHTHGGQIRLPLIGPLIGQSLYGVRYCSGVFYERPTLLHVSRGVSGVEPIRIHCRPEITKLILHRPTD